MSLAAVAIFPDFVQVERALLQKSTPTPPSLPFFFLPPINIYLYLSIYIYILLPCPVCYSPLPSPLSALHFQTLTCFIIDWFRLMWVCNRRLTLNCHPKWTERRRGGIERQREREGVVDDGWLCYPVEGHLLRFYFNWGVNPISMAFE